MSAAENTLRRLLARHVQAASYLEVERLAEAIMGERPAVGAAEIPRKLSMADGRYLRIDHDKNVGLAAAISEDRWVATWDRETDIVWTHVLGNVENGQSHSKSVAAAQAFKLFGVACDAPEIRPQLTIIDYGRYDPAVDPQYFRGPYGWHWTKTVAKYPAGCAWGVDLVGGSAGRFRQSIDGRVRGVVAGQSLGLRY